LVIHTGQLAKLAWLSLQEQAQCALVTATAREEIMTSVKVDPDNRNSDILSATDWI